MGGLHLVSEGEGRSLEGLIWFLEGKGGAWKGYIWLYYVFSEWMLVECCCCCCCCSVCHALIALGPSSMFALRRRRFSECVFMTCNNIA